MPRPALVFVAIAAVMLSAPAPAQTMFRWVDRNGRVHYSDDPPPAEAHGVEQKSVGDTGIDRSGLPFAVRTAADRYPVTLYSTAGCSSLCAAARDFLQRRGVPFSERAVQTKDDANALSQALGGQEPVVPSLGVGRTTAKGYQEAEWRALLDAAGYPKSRR